MANLAIKGGTPLRTEPFPIWPQYDEREKKNLIEVLESRGWDRTRGTKVVAFEQAFARYQDAEHGLAVANGTAALEIALKAAGIEAGDEVIVPSYTFVACATSVLQVNGVPVFVDIDDTFTMDCDAVEAAITEKTSAIMPVHFAGHAADMARILEIAEDYGLVVIEDSCHGWGATWNDRKLGAIGKAGAFSFQATKNITAGEGGIIVTNDQEFRDHCFSLHHVGRGRGDEWYQHVELGWNYRMTEWQAAILLAQLERLEDQTVTRCTHGDYLAEQFSQMAGLTPQKRDPRATRMSYHIFILEYDPEAWSGVSRNTLLKALNAEGIPCNLGYRFPLQENPLFAQAKLGRTGCPLTCHEYGRKMDYASCETPRAKRATRSTIWIPQNVLLGTREDMDQILAAFQKIRDNLDELTDL